MIVPTIRDVLCSGAQWATVLGDAWAVFRSLESESVDHVITDLPYDARTHRGAKCAKGAPGGVPFAPSDPAAVVPQLLRVARRWVLTFSAMEDLGAYRDAAGAAWVRSGFWDRINPSPQLSGDRPAQPGDGVAIMHRRGKKRWNGGGGAAIWRATPPRNDQRPKHPCPKPLPVMLDMVSAFTDPGDVVLDPYMGSASTGVACLLLGRRFIGVEISAEYHAEAVHRLEQAAVDVRGGVLFAQAELALGEAL